MSAEPPRRPVVHVAQPIHPVALGELAARYALSLGFGPGAVSTPEALAVADALVVRTLRVQPDWLDAAPRLRVVVRAGSGLDGLDLDDLTRRGIRVHNTAGANAVSVAEHVVALALAAARSLVTWDALARAGEYDRRLESPGRQLGGRTWGVVGYGSIGRAVAWIAHAGLGMRVLAYGGTRLASDPGPAEAVANLDVLLRDSDVVSLHVPLTARTRGMIGAGELASMRADAILVNAARGPVLDGDALLAALHAGRLHAAALDVWDGPMPPPPHPLYDAPRLLLSPHRAGRTVEADEAIGRRVVDLLARELGR